MFKTKIFIGIVVFFVIIMGFDVGKAQEFPDLIITDIVWGPLNPSVGSFVTFTATIKNMGGGASLDSYVYFYIDGAEIKPSISMMIGSIPAGGSTTATSKWIVQSGSFSVKAVADALSWVSESDESNNEKTVNFIGTPSDLIISDITWSPASPAVGSLLTFTSTIKNQGGGASLDSYVYFYIDGAEIKPSISMMIGSIPAGGSTTATSKWIVQSGSHSVKAVADVLFWVSESDESNNEKTVNFIGTPSDLIISDITLSPPSPIVGSLVTFTATIKNQGGGDSLDSYVYYYIDGAKIAQSGVRSMPAGGSTTATFQWDAQSGSHSVKAVADAPFLISESDETNNEKTLSVQISSTPTPIYTNPPTSTPTITPTYALQPPAVTDTSPPSISLSKQIVDFNDNGQLEEGEKLDIIYGANDENGVKSIKVLLDGTLIDLRNNQGTFHIITDSLSMGDHSIVVEAIDSKGNKKSEEMMANVARSGPSVYFPKSKFEVTEGEEIPVYLSAINPIGNPKMDVQLILKPQSSGISISGSDCESQNGMCKSSYSIGSEDGVRGVSVNMRADRAGEYPIQAEVYYQFENGVRSPTRYETFTLVVKPKQMPTSINAQTQPTPGFSGELAIIAVLFIAIYIRKRF